MTFYQRGEKITIWIYIPTNEHICFPIKMNTIYNVQQSYERKTKYKEKRWNLLYVMNIKHKLWVARNLTIFRWNIVFAFGTFSRHPYSYHLGVPVAPGYSNWITNYVCVCVPGIVYMGVDDSFRWNLQTKMLL